MCFLTDAGPMWFLYVLLLLTAGYPLWRQITKSDSLQQYVPKELSVPRYSYLLLLAIGLVSPIDEFPLGIPFGFMAQYAMMFSVGVIAARLAIALPLAVILCYLVSHHVLLKSRSRTTRRNFVEKEG